MSYLESLMQTMAESHKAKLEDRQKAFYQTNGGQKKLTRLVNGAKIDVIINDMEEIIDNYNDEVGKDKAGKFRGYIGLSPIMNKLASIVNTITYAKAGYKDDLLVSTGLDLEDVELAAETLGRSPRYIPTIYAVDGITMLEEGRLDEGVRPKAESITAAFAPIALDLGLVDVDLSVSQDRIDSLFDSNYRAQSVLLINSKRHAAMVEEIGELKLSADDLN